jgi:hypothetical protein
VLVVTALCIVPGGLICARIEGVGLRDVAHASEEVAGEEIAAS